MLAQGNALGSTPTTALPKPCKGELSFALARLTRFPGFHTGMIQLRTFGPQENAITMRDLCAALRRQSDLIIGFVMRSSSSADSFRTVRSSICRR